MTPFPWVIGFSQRGQVCVSTPNAKKPKPRVRQRQIMQESSSSAISETAAQCAGCALACLGTTHIQMCPYHCSRIRPSRVFQEAPALYQYRRGHPIRVRQHPAALLIKSVPRNSPLASILLAFVVAGRRATNTTNPFHVVPLKPSSPPFRTFGVCCLLRPQIEKSLLCYSFFPLLSRHFNVAPVASSPSRVRDLFC